MTRGFARAAAVVALLCVPLAAHARPLYFQNLTTIYGIAPGEDLYACGVCHLRWGGTGARNPYGSAVEAQLYLGKSIVQAITDIAGDDTDGDGFTNGDELATYRTLPGYNCTDFDLVINPPPNLQSLITPLVPSCLEPKDIKTDPTEVSFATRVGDTNSFTLQVENNGADFPIQVTGIELVAGAPASLSISAPTLPLSIPVGQSIGVTLTFTPPVSLIDAATLRITSDDPDEAQLDVPVSLLSYEQPLAAPDVRGACLEDLQKQLERLAKARLGAYGRCFRDELRGIACDAGRRDLAVAKAEAKLRATVGGERDMHCAASALSASLLGLPAQCGAPCASISLSSIPKVADCAVCQAAAATDAMLTAAVGTAPPDLPANRLGTTAWRCNQQLLIGIQKSIRGVQKSLGECELAAVLAGNTSPTCATDRAADLTQLAAQADARFGRCTDTTGMLGCLFAPSADPGCLGAAAVQIGTSLVATVF